MLARFIKTLFIYFHEFCFGIMPIFSKKTLILVNIKINKSFQMNQKLDFY